MSTFVLVHGAWHGAWCWTKLVPMLEQAGHKVITFDLPGLGKDTTPLKEVTLESYVKRTVEVINQQNEPVILVGHSMGGLVITQTAELIPAKIQTLVYLTAFLLENDQTLLNAATLDSAAQALTSTEVNQDEGWIELKPEKIKEVFYHDCPDEDVEFARQNLVKQALAPFVTPMKTSEANFGRVERVYVECLQDQAISINQQRKMYGALSCKSVIVLDTSHSPFLSAPEELARNLLLI